MMAVYELGWAHPILTGNEAVFSVIAGSAARARLLEVDMHPQTTSSATLALGRPTSQGTPSTSVVMLPLHPSDPTCPVSIGQAWSVQPGRPLSTTGWLRMWQIGSAGLPWRWYFPKGLLIPTSDSVVLWAYRASVGTGVTDFAVSVDV